MRTHVWLWRPRCAPPARSNSMFAVAKSRAERGDHGPRHAARKACRRARRAETGDRRVAVQVLRGAVAQRQRVVPEQLVENGDVVADERGLVALERSRDFGDDVGTVDLDIDHACSGVERRKRRRGNAARRKRSGDAEA